jgi:hypothetical protein
LGHSGGLAQRPWHKIQRLIRHNKRIRDHARPVVETWYISRNRLGELALFKIQV